MLSERSSPPQSSGASGYLSYYGHPSSITISSGPSSSVERLPTPGPESSLARLITEDEIPPTSGPESSLARLISDNNILSTIPTRPSPAFSGSSSREPSFYGTTACPTPSRDSWAEKEKYKYSIDHIPLRPASTCSTTFETRLDTSAYVVQKLHNRDDHQNLTPLRRFLARLTPLFTLISIAAYINYFFWRIRATRDEENQDHKIYLLAWFFITAEAVIAVPGTFQNFWLIISARGRTRPKLRLSGPLAPTVDVFITCCKEDVDVVLDTTRAACGIDYPQDRFRVVVLDDGADTDLQFAIEHLRQTQYPNLYYHARTKVKGVPHHYKAGNLIGGTDLVTKLEGGAGEFIAALDADMIPQPDWLRAIVAHAVNDPKVALVCPPQLFYNIPPDDPLVQSLDAFVHVTEPAKDAMGVAWCTGSGYIIRRFALDSIGGWPLGSLAEDVCTSSMLLGAGWRTVYCHEGLQYGLVPDTFSGHLKQRTRWTLGTLQTACKLRFFIFSPLVRKMTFFQRLSGFVFSVDALFKIFYPIAIATIPVVLVAGKKLVAYSSEDQLRWLVRWCLVMLASQRFNEWVTFIPSGYRLGRHESRATIWMAPYHCFTIIRSFLLPSWLGGKTMAFAPSGSLKSELNERYKHLRAPLHRRLKVILWDCKAYLHVLFVLFTLAAVILSTVRAFLPHQAKKPTLQILEHLLTHAFWPPVMWIIMVFALCRPVKYAIFPPDMPEREDMLDRDPVTQIAHPKKEWREQRWTGRTHWHELVYGLTTVYTLFIGIGSFVYWDTDSNGVVHYWFGAQAKLQAR